MDLLSKLSPRRFDWALITSTWLLVIVGLAAIYSVDLSRGSELIYFKKQLIAVGVGFILLIAAASSRPAFFRSYAKVIYLGCFLLLAGVLIFGQTIRGTRGWFVAAGFSFQPVEAAKIGLIFLLAAIIDHFGRRFEGPLFFFGTAFLTVLLVGLVFLQPDLGSALILVAVWFGLMVLVGVPWRYVGGVAALALIAAVVGWFFLLKPYQKDRIMTFVDPERDALGAGYNSAQALIAVGAGQWLGRGLGFGSQSQLKFLPEAQTDFIFSVVAEELGFAGAAAVIICYAVLLWRLWLIARRSQDNFVAAGANGILILFFSQFFINVGANIGVLPITGVTLPLVSYGGSSLVVNLFLIGVAEAMVEKKN